MKNFELHGRIRKAGNKAMINAFRREGLVPCNLYGKGQQNVLFTVKAKDLRALTHTPAAYIITLLMDDNSKYTAILHETQFHPVEDICLHVDFLAVNEEDPIAIDVPVNITGHAAGVQAGGKFVQLLRRIRVSAQMKYLPDQLDIDVTSLGIGGRIVAGDLKYDNVCILTRKNSIICTVRSSRQVTAAAAGEAGGEGTETAADQGTASAE